MSLVSFTPITDGSTSAASQVNTPLSTIYNDYNGNITDANIASTAAIAFSKVSGGSTAALVAWTAFSPVITSATGTITTSSSSNTTYVQIGKTVIWSFAVSITTNGTGAGGVVVTLPVTAANSTGVAGFGRADSVSGKQLQAKLTSTTSATIFNADGTYPASDGEALRCTFIYQAA